MGKTIIIFVLIALLGWIAALMEGDEHASDSVDMFDLEEIKEIADYLMVYYEAHTEGD